MSDPKNDNPPPHTLQFLWMPGWIRLGLRKICAFPRWCGTCFPFRSWHLCKNLFQYQNIGTVVGHPIWNLHSLFISNHYMFTRFCLVFFSSCFTATTWFKHVENVKAFWTSNFIVLWPVILKLLFLMSNVCCTYVDCNPSHTIADHISNERFPSQSCFPTTDKQNIKHLLLEHVHLFACNHDINDIPKNGCAWFVVTSQWCTQIQIRSCPADTYMYI